MRVSYPPEPTADWALFLDVDGTLVELAEHPDAVTPSPQLPLLLQRLRSTLGGAVAVISGRSLEAIEALLPLPDMPMAGVHGLERRDAQGRIHRSALAPDTLDAARRALAAFTTANPGTHYEDKGAALALHYRDAPRSQAAAARLMEEARRALGEAFTVQPGKFVFELKPVAQNKGTAVATFLEEPPFRDRLPVFLGDDVTDEDAFREVQARGGYGIRVGPLEGSAAQWNLTSVTEVLEWLDSLPARLRREPIA
jgi:trehalose 6-phosphate phosphatase